MCVWVWYIIIVLIVITSGNNGRNVMLSGFGKRERGVGNTRRCCNAVAASWCSKTVFGKLLTRRIRRDYWFCNIAGGVTASNWPFLCLNNNGWTGFNVKIVSSVCNSDNNLGRGDGGGYVQRTIPHRVAIAQSSSGPDWRLSGESKGNLLLRFSFLDFPIFVSRLVAGHCKHTFILYILYARICYTVHFVVVLNNTLS